MSKKSILVSRDGLTCCPGCNAHIRVSHNPDETICPFCSAPLVAPHGDRGAGLIDEVRRNGRGGLLALTLAASALPVACYGIGPEYYGEALCDDGIDNDGNGLTDCDDSECYYNSTVCGELCDDGYDNDGDGARDCEDPDCATAPECRVEDVCDDGVDDDEDGRVDCADPDCEGDPACVEQVCDDEIDDDGDGDIDCADEDCDGAAACTELACDDDIDNDADGFVDCEDADCARTEACAELVCDDDVDNDGDGNVDCDDDDCDAVALCGGTEAACADGEDDDQDGLTDCDDDDCDADSACTGAIEVACDDGVDGDGDGDVDCADEDCAESAACGACPVEDLGEALGVDVFVGSTVGAGNESTSSCGGDAAPELELSWTAPANGSFIFDTDGSAFDTIIYVRDSTCTGAELGCDDDGGGNRTSALKLDLELGQTVVVVLDGFAQESGEVRLSITESP